MLLATRKLLIAAAVSALVPATVTSQGLAESNGNLEILTVEFAAEREFATTWIGAYVYSAARGTAIGRVRDLVLAKDGNTITHAVLDVGASLGVGETLVAVPVSRLDITAEDGQQRFTADIDKSELIEAATTQ